jgi:hypothetical protein
MHKTAACLAYFTVLVLLTAQQGLGFDAKHIVRLKQAGVSDQTIELIIQEKVIETAAFTVEDIIDIKRAGLSERTLQMLINESSFLKKAEPVVYGKDISSLRFVTASDVIEFKRAGFSDEVIQSILAVAGEHYTSEKELAWDLLRNLDIRVYLHGDK